MRVATPSVPAIYAPHVFQGNKADVSVPASSRVLDKFMLLLFLFRFRKVRIGGAPMGGWTDGGMNFKNSQKPIFSIFSMFSIFYVF